MQNNVFIMTKIPYLKVCKKRLAYDIGAINSRRFITNNIEYYRKLLSHQKKYKINYYLTPREKFRTFSFTIFNNIIGQNGNCLGDKIWHLKKINKGPLILFGSDIPDIKISYIKNLFNILKYKDVVIGPTFDGGFWAIGFSNKRNISYPFKDIRWSSSHTLEDLIKNLSNLNIDYKISQKLRDIDILKDYCDYVFRFR